LKISCSNAEFGCTTVVKLDALNTHLQECEFNPKKPIVCDKGCGLTMPKDELVNHNCVRELRALVQSQQNKIQNLESEASELKLLQNDLKREVLLLKESLRVMRLNAVRRDPNLAPESEDVRRWVSSLQLTRVTRWGGMISTPDAVLQTVIKRALMDSGCPGHIVNELMENSHERRWPPGLSTLEARQLNRRVYENYICKRIPGKQAVVVMSCENMHMAEDMIMEPGLVMIFAHGVE
jgi:E3 ubiquitin-protein ligase NRDP1